MRRPFRGAREVGKLTDSQVKDMVRWSGLDIPEAKLAGVALRLPALLSQMEAIEQELGTLMDAAEPVPPVYPQEPAD